MRRLPASQVGQIPERDVLQFRGELPTESVLAAHPMKTKNSGEIVEVEDGEAEWLLDVLEELMDFYYAGPARASLKRAALNQKLKDLGKPSLKTP